MTVNIVELWNRYADVLWENGPNKTVNHRYILDVQAIINKNAVEAFDDDFIDLVKIDFHRRGNRYSTINRKISCISKLLRKHQRAGGLDRLPDLSKFPERNGRTRFLTDIEEARLLREMDMIDPLYGALCRFLIDTGARYGEAIDLKWMDIQGPNCTFWETKAGLPRSVPMTARVRELLRELQGSRSVGPFSRIKYCNFRNAWVRAKRRIGLGEDAQVVPHVLRHTCASRLAQSGIDIKRIQEFLGHKNISMTMRYAHLAPVHLEDCARALEERAAAAAL